MEVLIFVSIVVAVVAAAYAVRKSRPGNSDSPGAAKAGSIRSGVNVNKK
jgi:hypothetical protein